MVETVATAYLIKNKGSDFPIEIAVNYNFPAKILAVNLFYFLLSTVISRFYQVVHFSTVFKTLYSSSSSSSSSWADTINILRE